MRNRSRSWLYLRVSVAVLLTAMVVGLVAESPATATTLPTTSVLVPANGATLSGTTATLDASASNATSVEFWILGGSYGYSGHLIGTATPTLYGWVTSWNTTTVPNGSYALLSEAFGAGGSAFSAAVSITVSNPPTTSVLVPANGATLSGTTATLDASASNATSVEFWILGGSYGYSGHLIGTATPTLYGWVTSWNTTTVPNGSYALLSEAFGAGGSAFSAAVSITVNGRLSGVTQSDASCAVLSGGGVDCWGGNGYGELGAGLNPSTTNYSDVPVPVSGISDAVSVSMNTNGLESCAVLSSGRVDCWGGNDYGELGAGLNPSTTNYSDVPVAVSGISNAVSISTSSYDTFCAVLSSGGVDCWGQNEVGELGAGLTTTYSDVPVPVSGISDAVSIGSSELLFCAVLSNGGVDCWGNNYDGQLGAGLNPSTTTYSDVPVAVSGISNAVSVIMNDIEDASCAVLSNGGVDCWGENFDGSLGAGLNPSTTTYSDVPVAVSGISNAVSGGTSGDFTYCAVLSSGGVDCWGNNGFGQLGNGSSATYSDVPVAVSGISNALNISTSDATSCARLSGGGVDCWGGNGPDGELGAGLNPSTTTYSDVPVAVSGISDAVSVSYNSSYDIACAVVSDGGMDCWGTNAGGALGAGLNPSTTTYSDVPVVVSAHLRS